MTISFQLHFFKLFDVKLFWNFSFWNLLYIYMCTHTWTQGWLQMVQNDLIVLILLVNVRRNHQYVHYDILIEEKGFLLRFRLFHLWFSLSELGALFSYTSIELGWSLPNSTRNYGRIGCFDIQSVLCVLKSSSSCL